MEQLSPSDEARFQELIQQLSTCRGKPCSDCTLALSDEEILFSNALGFKDQPRCLDCLAARLQREKNDLKNHLLQHIKRRPCLARAHQVACGNCNTLPTKANPAPVDMEPSPPHNDLWNAGDLGCGDLVLLLRGKMRALPPGTILKVIANDPGAPEDIPAWCNMTRHRLVSFQHPEYFIQARD